MDQLIAILAEVIDVAKAERTANGRTEAARYLSIAVTELQSAQNWVVRANHELQHYSDAAEAQALAEASKGNEEFATERDPR